MTSKTPNPKHERFAQDLNVSNRVTEPLAEREAIHGQASADAIKLMVGVKPFFCPLPRAADHLASINLAT